MTTTLAVPGYPSITSLDTIPALDTLTDSRELDRLCCLLCVAEGRCEDEGRDADARAIKRIRTAYRAEAYRRALARTANAV